MLWESSFEIEGREISLTAPTYFVADIAANHDGDLSRAKDLIWLAKKAGADAVKFQHFKAKSIVSDAGFKSLGGQMAHQANWGASVYEIYEKYEADLNWTDELIKTAEEADIHFFTTPYNVEAVEELDARLPAYKIGSGDITWTDFISTVAQKKKPILVATGASTMEDVKRAVAAVLAHNPQLVLMQCNTNYTGSLENFKYINLNVLKSFAAAYPGMVLGLSDHSPGCTTVLGAIALGARVVEKHFTDDTSRDGPDHPFSMDETTWREMVDRSRELEKALGDGQKAVEKNEEDSLIVQQRCLRFTRDMAAGEVLTADDLEPLRPAPAGSVRPFALDEMLGKTLTVAKSYGDALYAADCEA